jgi:hypothetical protein
VGLCEIAASPEKTEECEDRARNLTGGNDSTLLILTEQGDAQGSTS